MADTAKRLLERGEHGTALELASSTWRAWVLARDDAGGRAFLALVLDATAGEEPSRARALTLYGDGLLALRLGDLAASRVRNERALEDARRTSDREAEGLALLGLSRVDLSEKRAADARRHAASARETLRSLGGSYGQAPLQCSPRRRALSAHSTRPQRCSKRASRSTDSSAIAGW